MPPRRSRATAHHQHPAPASSSPNGPPSSHSPPCRRRTTGSSIHSSAPVSSSSTAITQATTLPITAIATTSATTPVVSATATTTLTQSPPPLAPSRTTVPVPRDCARTLSSSSTIRRSYRLSSTAVLVLQFALFTLFAVAASAAKVLKYNAGGFAIAGYATDPSATVKGANHFYRAPTIGDLTIGRSHRWGDEDGFTYELPVGDANVTLNVDLIFAEIYESTGAPGKRRFNVFVEENKVLDEVDVFVEAGGLNKEWTKSVKGVKVSDGFLSLLFARGSVQNPMVSGFRISRADGKDFNIEVDEVEGTGKNPASVNTKGFDHQAHAIAAGPYIGVDFNEDNTAEITLDGSGSHSHYFNSETQETGRIVSYLWTFVNAQGKTIVLGRKKYTKAVFPIGTHTVSLEVKDQFDDVASAKTKVVIKPATTAGSYCYFYDTKETLKKQIDSSPKPVEGYSTNVINFREDEFQYSKKDQYENQWAMRCVSDFLTKTTGTYSLSVDYRGRGAELWVNNGKKASAGNSQGKLNTIKSNVVLPVGQVSVQVIYYAGGSNPALAFKANDKVVPPNVLSYKASEVIPSISSISDTNIKVQGGGSLAITGTGFFNTAKLVIKFGPLSIKAGNDASKPNFLKITGNELLLRNVPSKAAIGGSSKVSLAIDNGFSTSNTITLTYTETARGGVSWEQTYVKTSNNQRLNIKQITGIALGPDQHYYLSSLAGRVYNMQLNRDLTVASSCPSDSLKRPILGLAFDYSQNFDLYVTTSSLYWNFGGEFKGKPDGWANGAVERFRGTSCGKCMCYDRKIVTGLPVSNHDHGVNGIVIKDGSMFISNGGATNAGHNTPGNKLGGFPESPLSAAVLTANFRKAGFDGKVRYSQYTNPESAKKTGGDVEVYASGLRNSFGLTMRLNGELWATDNGGNPGGYGDRLTGCGPNDHKKFTGKDKDKIIKLEKGKYYGHPNKARNQCSTAGAVKANAMVESSMAGIAEYTANAFRNALTEHMVFTKFAAGGTGKTTSSAVTGNGKITPKQTAQYSGVAVTTGMYGELIMPRVQQGFIAVLKPQYGYTGSAPFVVAVAPPRGVPGRTVVITGLKLKGSGTTKVFFGTKEASAVKVRNEFEIECKVPAGSGKVYVYVTIGSSSSQANKLPPFRYEG